jgi:hypothetical protein
MNLGTSERTMLRRCEVGRADEAIGTDCTYLCDLPHVRPCYRGFSATGGSTSRTTIDSPPSSCSSRSFLLKTWPIPRTCSKHCPADCQERQHFRPHCQRPCVRGTSFTQWLCFSLMCVHVIEVSQRQAAPQVGPRSTHLRSREPAQSTARPTARSGSIFVPTVSDLA